MAKTKLGKYPSRNPIDVSKDAWFYEEGGHVKVIAQLTTETTGEGRRYIGTTHTSIPMKLLCRTVDRYRKAKAKRRRASVGGRTDG